jgi:hypothetical protein
MLKTYKDTKLIKVLDPRHPLFGGEFRLLETIKSKSGSTLCVIELKPSVRRRIPIEVTDLGDPLNIHTLPVDVASLANFCDTYHRGEYDVKATVADESFDHTE